MSESTPPPDGTTRPSLDASSAVGTRIGPYRLLEVLGEGGMGTVYLAEQREPVHRKVALKIIKLGMDTRDVIARFETERQALALMNHDSVARVLDGGSTEHGRPFFVMEYVAGLPITKHCDRQKLSPRERIELFLKVCEGVQHAHQKAIIHRDLKPSNVLVSMDQGRATPKIIDFGVAKATSQPLTKRTLYTEMGVLIGTPEYMSPEQADLTGQGVDTRTDVYALGVMLYELLTGALPFESDTLRDAGFDGIRRLIREQEPQRPSARFSTLDGSRSRETAVNRRSDPRSLRRLLRGDLDWITMKALSKDRSQRYASCSEFADDLRNFLRDEPVKAGPPSATYRLRKLARRHRVLLGSVVAVMLALTLGLGAAVYGYVRAERSAEEARLQSHRAEATNRFLQGILTAADPTSDLGPKTPIQDVLDQAAKDIDDGQLSDEALVEAGARQTMGLAYVNLGLFDQAASQLHAALALRRATLAPDDSAIIETLNALGRLERHRGNLEASEEYYREALAALPIDPPTFQRASLLNDLGLLLEDLGETEEAVKLLEESLSIDKQLGRERDLSMATSLNNLALATRSLGDLERTEELFEETIEILREVFGPEHVHIASVIESIGSIAHRRGDLDRAEKMFLEALEMRRRLLGESHPAIANSYNGLGLLYADMEKHEASEEMYLRALEMKRDLSGADHPTVANTLSNMGLLYTQLERYDDARQVYDEAIEIRVAKLGPDHPHTLNTQNNLAQMLVAVGELDAARSKCLEIQRLAENLPEGHPYHARFSATRASVLYELKRYEDAEQEALSAFEKAVAAEGEGSLQATRTAEILVKIYDALGDEGKSVRWKARSEPAASES